VVIGVTTALLTVVGLYAGRRFGAMFGPRLEILGGIVLVGIGAKILFDHFRAT
jgi:putative Mn2+ efflux pump MntP